MVKRHVLVMLICGQLLLMASPLLIAQSVEDGFTPILGTSGQVGESTGIAAMHVQPDGKQLIAGQHQSDFMLVNTTDQCSGQNIPVSSFCGFEVIFNPSVAGIRQAQLHIISNAPGGPELIRLSGTNDVLFFDGFDDE